MALSDREYRRFDKVTDIYAAYFDVLFQVPAAYQKPTGQDWPSDAVFLKEDSTAITAAILTLAHLLQSK